MPRIIFHLDLDVFFVAVERQLDPTLIGKPVIVSPGTSRSVVSTASYEARTFGVHSAQPLTRARRLCPQAIICPGNFRAYQEYSRAFFNILEDYSPDLESGGLDEGYLDYTACTRLFGPPLPAAAAIQARVKSETGLDVSIGISTVKVVSKIASDLAKPAGVLHVLPGYEAALLAPLPIRRLGGVGPKTETRLRALGIRTIGDLASVSRSLLSKAFGETGGWLHEAARGQDDSPVVRREQVKSVSNEETFAKDTTDPAFLRHALHRLVCEVGYRLRKKGLRAKTVCVKVRYADFSLHTRSLTLPAAADTDRTLFTAAVQLLDKAVSRRIRIRLVGFGAQKLEEAGAQGRFLDVADQERQAGLNRAADKIRGRYGYDTVRWASLLREDVE